MLVPQEARQLAEIEARLTASEPDLARVLSGAGQPPPAARRRRRLLAVLVTAIAVIAGLVLIFGLHTHQPVIAVLAVALWAGLPFSPLLLRRPHPGTPRPIAGSSDRIGTPRRRRCASPGASHGRLRRRDAPDLPDRLRAQLDQLVHDRPQELAA